MNMIVNQPKMMARPAMDRLKRMNILTIEIIREILTGPMLDDLLQLYKETMGQRNTARARTRNSSERSLKTKQPNNKSIEGETMIC